MIALSLNSLSLRQFRWVGKIGKLVSIMSLGICCALQINDDSALPKLSKLIKLPKLPISALITGQGQSAEIGYCWVDMCKRYRHLFPRRSRYLQLPRAPSPHRLRAQKKRKLSFPLITLACAPCVYSSIFALWSMFRQFSMIISAVRSIVSLSTVILLRMA